MMKSQTIPIQAAFQDSRMATVAVATGPIMKPEIQSRLMDTNYLTPVSSPLLVLRGKTQHLGFRNHALGHLRI